MLYRVCLSDLTVVSSSSKTRTSRPAKADTRSCRAAADQRLCFFIIPTMLLFCQLISGSFYPLFLDPVEYFRRLHVIESWTSFGNKLFFFPSIFPCSVPDIFITILLFTWNCHLIVRIESILSLRWCTVKENTFWCKECGNFTFIKHVMMICINDKKH